MADTVETPQDRSARALAEAANALRKLVDGVPLAQKGEPGRSVASVRYQDLADGVRVSLVDDDGTVIGEFVVPTSAISEEDRDRIAGAVAGYTLLEGGRVQLLDGTGKAVGEPVALGGAGGGDTSALPYLLTIGGDPSVPRPAGAGAYHHVETEGWVDWNNKRDGDRHTASPPPPPVLDPLSADVDEVTLTWSPSLGVVRYDVLNANSGAVVAAVSVASLADPDAPTATISGAEDGLSLAVRAVPAPLAPGEDPVIEGYASRPSNTRTADIDLTPPGDVFLTIEPTETGYTATWTNPADADLALVEFYESDDDQATPDSDRLGFFDSDPSPLGTNTETITGMVAGDEVWAYLRLSDDSTPPNVRTTDPVRVLVAPPPPETPPAAAAVPLAANAMYLAWTDTAQTAEIHRQVTATFEDDPANVVTTLAAQTPGARSFYVDDGTGNGTLGAPIEGQDVYYFVVAVDGAGQRSAPNRTSASAPFDPPPVDAAGVELSYTLGTSALAEGQNTTQPGFVVQGQNGRADVVLSDDTTGLVAEDVARRPHLLATGNSIDIKFTTAGRTTVVEFLCYAAFGFSTRIAISDGRNHYVVGVRKRDGGRLNSGVGTSLDATTRNGRGVGTGYVRMEVTEHGDGTATAVVQKWRGPDGWVQIASDTGPEHAGRLIIVGTGLSPEPSLVFPVRFYEAI